MGGWVLLAVGAGCLPRVHHPLPHRAQGHCLEVWALSVDGASTLRESGAPGFVRGARAQLRYHLDHGPGARVQVLDAPACVAAGVCDEGGALVPEALGQAPAAKLELAQTPVPGEVPQPLPVLGTVAVRVQRLPGVEGGADLVVSLRDSSEAEAPALVLWRGAAPSETTRARWYRAGEWLWVQFEADSPGVACSVARVDLRRAAADVLDARGVVRLREEDLGAARAALEAAVELAPEDAGAAYNLACALARSGDEASALVWLERALWLDAKGTLRLWALRDPDLAPLRGKPAFEALVVPARLEAGDGAGF